VIDAGLWLAAWNSPSAEPIVAICDPDIEVHAVTLGIEGRHYRGHEGVRQWMRDIRDRFHAVSHAESVTELAPDAVVVAGTLSMSDQGTGEPLDQRFAMLVHLRGDKAAWVGTFFSAADARAAWESGVTGPQPG
jgi:ketosteroid isomerase-like protein